MPRNDALGDRMKASYENRARYFLPRRTYTVIRLDGKAELIRQQWHPGSPSYEPWPSVQFARLILGASSSDEEPS